jgi:mannose-6-phosphate isomerase
MSAKTQSQLGVVRVVPVVQSYAWGKLGKNSKVAQLAGHTIDEDTPYAELWMGTHPSGPSTIYESKQSLKDFIGEELPFLFKVLSIRTALSIQAHPNKGLAAQLHKERPKDYKDANHKPEMACAVTAFEAMCGFRRFTDIARNLEDTPELRKLVGETLAQRFVQGPSKELLKEVFTQVMTATPEDIQTQVRALVGRLKPGVSSGRDLDIPELILRLQAQFGDDVGLFAPYLLHCFRMSPGECMFLCPDEPHAYISGDCVECMACSDNVVRAGLTPKMRDTATLCSMLTYRPCDVEVNRGHSLNTYTTLYGPPEEHKKTFPEFRLARTALPSNTTYSLPTFQNHSLLLVYEGEGALGSQTLSPGVVLFVPQYSKLEVVSRGELLLFQCFSDSLSAAL